MISKIDICSTATFGNASQSMDDFRKFNYFFGANGSGKTTISKILADESQFPNCRVTWKNNLELEARVYNRDFVDRNFTPQNKLKGVFTLGRQETDLNVFQQIFKKCNQISHYNMMMGISPEQVANMEAERENGQTENAHSR